MILATNLSWLYGTLAWVLLPAAVVLLAWALFVDRNRRKRRCPRCWYDMSGTPGLRCSECGREAKSEVRLHRRRRRWRWALVSVVLLVAAHGSFCVPRFQARGWVGFVPSTYLVYFAPVQGAPPPPLPVWSGAPLGTIALPASTPTLRQQLADELWSRLNGDSLAFWQSQAYLRRYITANQIDPGTIVHVPKTWPLGIDVPFRTSVNSIAGLTLDIGPRGAGPGIRALRSPASRIEAVVGLVSPSGRVVYRSRHAVPIDASLTPANFLQKVDSLQATADVQALISPHLALPNGKIDLVLFNRPDPEARPHLPFIIAFTCEVRAGDRILARVSESAPWKPDTRVVWSASQFDWPADCLELLRNGEATITVKGDPVVATGVYAASPFSPPERVCWSGEFTAPLPMRPHPRKPS